MKKIDARGLSCPEPVILTNKALADNNRVSIIVDNETAKSNILKLANKLNCEVSIKEDEEGIKIFLFKEGSNIDEAEKNNVNDLVYIIGKNRLGEGSEELGKLLIKGFLYSLSEMTTVPSKIAFLNSGVFLACEGSDSLEDLIRIQEKGTELFLCGTCLEYFNLKSKIKVGEISNMYDIINFVNSGKNTIVI